MVESLGVVGTVIAVLTGLAALVSIAAGLIAKFRSTADEQTLIVWKGEAEAQKARADRLEADLKTERGRVDRLEIEVHALRELVTGRQDMNEFARAMGARFDRLEALLTPAPAGVNVAVNGGNN
jgi:citrate lyase beta subunit